jgi:hypothetical protein
VVQQLIAFMTVVGRVRLGDGIQRQATPSTGAIRGRRQPAAEQRFGITGDARTGAGCVSVLLTAIISRSSKAALKTPHSTRFATSEATDKAVHRVKPAWRAEPRRLSGSTGCQPPR